MRAPSMRVPVKRDETMRSGRITRSSRGMAATAGTVFCILLVSCISLVDGATDPGDVSALNTMFTDLNNDPRLTNWVQSAGDPCGNNWLGVTCEGTFVTSIKLSSRGLNGKVQGWVLQKFQHLSVLDLSQNNFDGQIPEMYPPKLTDLNLSNNQFKGIFPYLLINIPSLTSIKLNNNKLDGTLNGQVFSKLGNVTLLDLSNNGFTGAIPGTIGDMTNLQFLYLQNNKLTGPIPTSLANLLVLDTLDVSNNMLTGYLPPNLNPKNFRHGGNQLSTSAPPPPPYTAPPPPKNPKPISPPKVTPDTPSKSSSFLTGPRIAGIVVVVILVLVAAALAAWYFVIRKRPERLKPSDLEANHSSRRTWFLPLIPTGKGSFDDLQERPFPLYIPYMSELEQWISNPVNGSRFGNLILFLSEWADTEKTTKMKVFEPDTIGKGMEEPKIKASPPVKKLKVPPVKALKVPPAFKGEEIITKKAVGKVTKSSISATAFSVADLQAATNSFSETNLLGEGSLGCVYRAEFPNGQVLAVKKLDTKASMVQNEDDFLGVVEKLARLKHTNSAELVGYCVEHGQRLLVYEYISRGTLNELLHGSVDNTKGLSWNVRVKIALGAARALEYLHEICSPPVVHRNFKSANILLDDELNPHVSDCGLAALAPSSGELQVSAQMLSSIGYSAPEYSMSGTYTVKSDVYSFGVVMLELVTGRKPLDSSRPRSEQNLVRWATPQLHDIDALAKMVDPALEGVYPAKSLSRFADIVALCVQPEPEFRPPMSEVVQSLIRLMQRATLSMRRTESDGASQSDIQDPYDY